MTIEQQAIEMAESFLNRARHELSSAKSCLEAWHYAESISSAQQCIELSLKAIFLLLGEKYPRRHYFTDDEAEKLLQKVPKELRCYEFPRTVYLF
ncbi:HEPN domain-containing protein [Dehalococcoidia bacterium]|nr:HEPN domain-containing protein [Dehalococcoidia bacterium]